MSSSITSLSNFHLPHYFVPPSTPTSKTDILHLGKQVLQVKDRSEESSQQVDNGIDEQNPILQSRVTRLAAPSIATDIVMDFLKVDETESHESTGLTKPGFLKSRSKKIDMIMECAVYDCFVSSLIRNDVDKAIFLFTDGVVNTSPDNNKTYKIRELAERLFPKEELEDYHLCCAAAHYYNHSAMKNLKSLILNTNAVVVIAGNLRIALTVRQLRQIFCTPDFSALMSRFVIDRTPESRMDKDYEDYAIRCNDSGDRGAINYWLQKHKINQFVVLGKYYNFGMRNFVKVDSEVLLTQQDVEKAQKTLEGTLLD